MNDSIALLQQQMVSGESSPARLEVEKAALAAELESVARGAQIRAHIQWAEEGERSTKYFLRQEKLRGQRRLIAAIRRPMGHSLDQPVTFDLFGVIIIISSFPRNLLFLKTKISLLIV